MVNLRRSQLSMLELTLVLALTQERGGVRKRKFYNLALERRQVAFFPLHLTVVHPIDDDSPLWGLGPEGLAAGEAEVLVLVTALDEALSQTTHTRTSYRFDELVWGAKFADMFESPQDGRLRVDLGRLDAWEPAALPAVRP
jgi:inward rectifier potassium channel